MKKIPSVGEKESKMLMELLEVDPYSRTDK